MQGFQSAKTTKVSSRENLSAYGSLLVCICEVVFIVLRDGVSVSLILHMFCAQGQCLWGVANL